MGELFLLGLAVVIVCVIAWNASDQRRRATPRRTAAPLPPLRESTRPSATVYDDYPDEAVGERSYQKALARITGGSTYDCAEHHCTATLRYEDDNPYDPGNAIRVEVDGLLVGYLARAEASRFRRSAARAAVRERSFTCPGVILGGWDRGADQG